MGFFSDLKEDLSQAVNELVPEGEAGAANAGAAVDAGEQVDEAAVSTQDIDAMLSKVDEIEIPEEEVYVAPIAESKREYANTAKNVAEDTAVISECMMINGDIASQGSLDLKGAINGNIEILGKLVITGTIQGNSQASEVFADGAKITGELRSQGSMKIGQSSVIIGNVFANSAVIAGAVKGDIDVHGPVILDASAIVMGNIKSKSVQINNGAVIEGMCSQCYADVNPTSFFEEIKKAAI